MEIDILDLEGELPFSQKILIDGKRYEFIFEWIKYKDNIMYHLKDDEGNFLSQNKVMRLREPLFSHMIPDITGKIPQEFPQLLIIPVTIDGTKERVSKENFLKNVVLALFPIEWYMPTSGVTLWYTTIEKHR